MGRSNQQFTYSMGGQMIEAVSEQKYLGIIVMDSCHPSEQCAAAAKKANKYWDKSEDHTVVTVKT